MENRAFRAGPVALFAALACGIVWVLFAMSRLLHVPFGLLLIAGSWAPNIAAVLVTGLVLREKRGIRPLFAGWLRRKFSPVLGLVTTVQKRRQPAAAAA